MLDDKRKRDAIRARAEAIVRKLPCHDKCGSIETEETLIAALTEDLSARVDEAAINEERLAKIEAQTRGLAEAVIAITDQGLAVAPAVQAVKDEM